MESQVCSAQDTSPFAGSVVGEPSFEVKSEWEHSVFYPLCCVWVHLLLSSYLDLLLFVAPQEAGIMQPVTFSVGVAIQG